MLRGVKNAPSEKKKWFWRLLIYQVLQVQTKIEHRSLQGVLDIKNVIKSVKDLQQVGGFHRVFRFPLPIKLTATI